MDEQRVDKRDAYVQMVLNDMGPYLSAEQLQLLRDTLYTSTKNIEITSSCKALTVNLDTNVDIVKRFIVAKKIQGLSEKTLKYYFGVVKEFLSFTSKRVQDMTGADIQLFIAEVMGRSSKCNADNVRRVLSTFFNWCVEDDVIVKTPMAKIKKIKYPKHIRQPFTAEEVEKMRQICGDNIRNRAILEFLLSTACRVSEMVGLNRKDVDLLTGEAVVVGKGAKERTVYLNAPAKWYLKQYFESRKDDNPALFVSELQPFNRLEISGIEILIRRLGRTVNAKAFPHKLRHTAATNALRRGMPIEQVQKMLGHEKIDTTLIYAKIVCDDVKYAHNKYC